MIISQVFQPPWSDIIFHAETVQRWFLLALLLGRATLVGGLWSGAGPVLQLMSLLCFFLLVPCCFSCGMDWCQSGGEYFLPTDWWPHCRSCLMTPKVLLSSLLFVGFSHFAPACARLMRTIPPLAAGVIFVVTCVLSEEVPAAQSAIEGDVQLDMMWQLPARLAGLLLIVVQTLSLASTGRAVLWHLRWPAKYLMGSYLLNLNFLDLCLLSPQVRWHIVAKILEVNVGPLRGICLWVTMLVPIVFFLFFAAPVLQTLIITWPWWIVSSITYAAGRVWTSWRMPRKRTSFSREPLLNPKGCAQPGTESCGVRFGALACFR